MNTYLYAEKRLILQDFITSVYLELDSLMRFLVAYSLCFMLKERKE
jgi:hypothetical protein